MSPKQCLIAFAIVVSTTVTAPLAFGKAVNTPLAPPHFVSVGDLIGRTPQEVQTLLAPEASGWPITFSLEVTDAEGGWAVAQARDLLQDAAAVESMARFRQQANFRLTATSLCHVTTTEGDPAPFTLLVFQGGKLASVWDGLPAKSVPIDPTGRAADDVLRGDGRTRLNVTDRRVISCDKTTFEADPPRRGPSNTTANLAGLGLLPLAITLPALNAHRIAAKRSGDEIYARLKPGTALPADLPETKRFKSASPDESELLVLNLGAYAGHNLTDFEDRAIIGVHEGLIVWRSLPWTGASLAPDPAPR